MYTLKTLTIAAIKMFVRNKQSAFFSLFMPLMIMIIFGFIGFDSVPTTKLGIVLDNPNVGTEQFVEQFNKIETFEIFKGTEQEERSAMESGDRQLILIIPNTLIPSPEDQQELQPSTIKVLTDVQQPQQVQVGLSVLGEMLDKTNLAITGAPELFKIEIEEVSSNNARYIDFLLPGIIAMAIMQMSIFSVAFVFADYKEKGILKRLMATPMRPFEFVTAQIITRLLVALIQTGILIAVGVFLLHTQVLGSYFLILLIAILGGIMFLGLGFVISGLSKTVEAVPAIANVVAFPMLFLSGIFFPMDAMPVWLGNIVQYLPLTYFANALRDVMGGGAGFGDVATDIYMMLAWSVVLILLANYTFSFEKKRI
ncbi:MAG: ABC transporter permease [bacterium]|nr:ABC transporter permease [bacterium]